MLLLILALYSLPEIPPKGDCVVVRERLRCTPPPEPPRPRPKL